LLLSSSKPSLGVFQLAGHLLHIPTSTWFQKFSIAVAVYLRRSFHTIITTPSVLIGGASHPVGNPKRKV
jgi:hypothetical protein